MLDVVKMLRKSSNYSFVDFFLQFNYPRRLFPFNPFHPLTVARFPI